jgi:hypothetical protein
MHVHHDWQGLPTSSLSSKYRTHALNMHNFIGLQAFPDQKETWCPPLLLHVCPILILSQLIVPSTNPPPAALHPLAPIAEVNRMAS